MVGIKIKQNLSNGIIKIIKKGENMKSYSKGILVGMSIVIGSLFLMGLTNDTDNTEVGRYQISITNDGGVYIYESIIDTKTGKVFKRNQVKMNRFIHIKK